VEITHVQELLDYSILDAIGLENDVFNAAWLS